MNDFCFEALFGIPLEHQKLVVDSIIWAFKHTERNVADTVGRMSLCLQCGQQD